MRTTNIKILITLLVLVTPFFVQAQISGSASLCAATVTPFSDANAGGVWASGNDTIASVDSSGNVTAINAGVVTLSYSYVNASFEMVIDTKSVTVNALPDAGYLYYPTEGTCPGSSTPFHASVSGGIWSSANTAIATVNESGLITGISPGRCYIIYTVSNGTCSASTSAYIYVNPPANAGTIMGVTSVCSGSVSALSDDIWGGSWSTSNAGIASVDANGNVTGVAVGNATISYTAFTTCGTAYATTNFNVNNGPAAIEGAASSICVQSTISLTDASTGGTWTSGNSAIVMVNSETGMVTAIAQGATQVVYTLPGGCNTSATVSVNPLPNPGSISGPSNVPGWPGHA